MKSVAQSQDLGAAGAPSASASAPAASFSVPAARVLEALKRRLIRGGGGNFRLGDMRASLSTGSSDSDHRQRWQGHGPGLADSDAFHFEIDRDEVKSMQASLVVPYMALGEVPSKALCVSLGGFGSGSGPSSSEGDAKMVWGCLGCVGLCLSACPLLGGPQRERIDSPNAVVCGSSTCSASLPQDVSRHVLFATVKCRLRAKQEIDMTDMLALQKQLKAGSKPERALLLLLRRPGLCPEEVRDQGASKPRCALLGDAARRAGGYGDLLHAEGMCKVVMLAAVRPRRCSLLQLPSLSLVPLVAEKLLKPGLCYQQADGKRFRRSHKDACWDSGGTHVFARPSPWPSTTTRR